jgi:hypothetical protein
MPLCWIYYAGFRTAVPGRLRMKSSPMIVAGVQQPGEKPSVISLSTIARELNTVRE